MFFDEWIFIAARWVNVAIKLAYEVISEIQPSAKKTDSFPCQMMSNI